MLSFFPFKRFSPVSLSRDGRQAGGGVGGGGSCRGFVVIMDGVSVVECHENGVFFLRRNASGDGKAYSVDRSEFRTLYPPVIHEILGSLQKNTRKCLATNVLRFDIFWALVLPWK